MSTKENINTLNSIIDNIKDNLNHSKIELDILQNIYNLSCNFFKIESDLKNVQTIASIARSFFDYYSVYHLLFLFGNDEEKDLRQKLYLCDGYKTVLKTLDSFKEIDKENMLISANEISIVSLENIKNTLPKNYDIFVLRDILMNSDGNLSQMKSL